MSKTIQELLNEEAELSNRRYYILEEIRNRRGPDAPVCFGEDDCSTNILSTCPWRFDCGSK